MTYSEEDFLQLSGLQHFKFCRRQWALIHIENQWAENFRTTDGAILHENAHNGGFAESRGDLFITRDMRIFSRTLVSPVPVTCWNSTGAEPVFLSRAETACGSPTRWNTSGGGPRRAAWMPSSCAARPCV